MNVTNRKPIENLGHWYHPFSGFGISVSEFYDEIERRIVEHEFPQVATGRVEFRESGWVSANRLYLRIMRSDLVFDICGAPFGKRIFFASCWLGRLGLSGCGTVGFGCLAMLNGAASRRLCGRDS